MSPDEKKKGTDTSESRLTDLDNVDDTCDLGLNIIDKGKVDVCPDTIMDRASNKLPKR